MNEGRVDVVMHGVPRGDCVIETQSDWGMRVGEWKGATGEILGRDPTKLMDDDPNRIGL